MNGYFQLITEENCTKLHIFAPTGNGVLVDVTEVSNYLKDRSIDFDLQVLSRGISDSEKRDVEIVLNQKTYLPERESYDAIISPDKMMIKLRFYAPSVGAERMTVQEILRDMIHKGIRYGIQEAAVKSFVEQPEYCKDIIVAQGKQPVHGQDGSIEYFFNTNPTAKPTANEDGSVDFHQLNIFSLCAAGQRLAKLTVPDPGEPGKNIKGETVPQREAKKKRLQYGRNIRLSEDGTELYSEVDGHVSLVNDKVFVSDILEVNNVDTSTGNIEYEGNVVIKGNVLSGYSVKVSGNIEVRGVVEGATLEAGGNIVIARGMNGMGKGTLKAGGDIIVKFIESVTAQAGGYIAADSILHSNVSAGTRIEVSGKRGFIAGGKVSATQSITVKTLGSSMGADTTIEVGVDPAVKRRIMEIQKALEDIEKNLSMIQPVLTMTAQKLAQGIAIQPEQLRNVQNLMKVEQQKKAEKLELEEELKPLQELIGDDVPAEIIVRGDAYPGTKICISDVSMTIKTPMTYCKFVKIRGDVKVSGL